jgi:acyl dehydratase
MKVPVDRDFDSFQIGERATHTHIISRELILKFADVSGDCNPLHVDQQYAARTTFGAPIAHGMLLGALVSELIGTELPGVRCLLVKASLEFKKPVFADDVINVIGEVVHKSDASSLLEIAISILRNDDVVVHGVVYTKVVNPHE